MTPPVIRITERPIVTFEGGALYRTVIGDDTGEGVPVRTGYQYSPPGYQVQAHSHPYTEILTVIAGRGEAWFDGEDERVVLEPGVTVVFPTERVHCFRVLGNETLVTLGIHAFGKRIVQLKD
jgi:mannose-6-phosphate isomerase-like protein (cupin superfamily)